MTRRYGQSGYVVKKGNMWHGRYYVDLQERRKRVSVPLGPVGQFTKPEAKRKLRDLLEQSGVNTEAHLLQAIGVNQTFSQEAAWWRKNKLSLHKPSCQETMGSHVDKYLLPQFGDLPINAVDERKVQEFIADLNRTELAPKSIRNILGVLKLILGKKRWQDWNLVLPEIPEREQRYFTEDEMRKIINSVEGSGVLSSQRWREQVFAVAKYSGYTLMMSIWHPAVSVFVGAFGMDRKSRLKLRAETGPWISNLLWLKSCASIWALGKPGGCFRPRMVRHFLRTTSEENWWPF
jgi:hypothetical protein